MRKQKTKFAALGTIAVLVAILITSLISFVLYEHTVSLLTDNLRKRLLAIVTTASVHFDPADIQNLQEEEDWQTDEWKKVVGTLLKIENNNSDIVFAYIFRKTDKYEGQMEFVADSHSINPYANSDADPANDVDANGDGIIEPDGPDFLQWPGQEYPEPPEETFSAYEGPLTSDLYEDAFGEVITGYSPIKNENGEVVAVLAIDIRAGDFFTITRQTLYPFLLFIFVLFVVIFVLARIIIVIWNRRVQLVEELDNQKDELLSMVSHQLATPVSSLKWYTEMLIDGDIGKISKAQKEHLESMQSISSTLSDLVGMILDVSRIQLGKVHIEKQDLKLEEVFKEILNFIEPQAKKKNQKFIREIPAKLPVALLDKRYTEMILQNLLSNAVKYTPEEGTISFKVKIINNKLSITVSDTGCGIPEKDKAQIFGKLFRASNVRNSQEGNGFGLYIVKGAVESQGGKIWFQSKEGKGTTFFVELPLK